MSWIILRLHLLPAFGWALTFGIDTGRALGLTLCMSDGRKSSRLTPKTLADLYAEQREVTHEETGVTLHRSPKSDFVFIWLDEVPEEFRDELRKWMAGQTMPLIDVARVAIYAHDWERFYFMKTRNRATYWD